MTANPIRERLVALRDAKYADFQRKLIPTVEARLIIGVRTPLLRAMAKELIKTRTATSDSDALDAWLEALPHGLFEENQLHALLISEERDFGRALDLTNRFLPHVDNWATCDQLAPKAFRRHRDALAEPIDDWLRSPHEYTVRFGIRMLMNHFLDDAFRPGHLDAVCAIRRPEYYICMMQAWYLATALAKQWDATLPCLTDRRLADPWTHNKTIQKAIESYRIPDDRKAFLKTLRRKETWDFLTRFGNQA